MKDKFLPALMLCSLMIVAVPAARAQSKLSGSSSVDTGDTGSPSVDLPPLPHSKSTTFGGEIQRVDPVRDELVLKVYGEKPMKIWFDERTLFYLDGNRIALHELHPESHAAVETTLDGASIFAVSIHALSHPPEGDYQGRVMSYDPASRTLTLNSSASREPFKVQVAADATFAREGQPDFTSIPSGASDLQTGSVVSIEFD